MSALSSKKSSISSHPVVVGVLASNKASSRDLSAVLGSDFDFDREYDPEDAARQLIAEEYGVAPASLGDEKTVETCGGGQEEAKSIKDDSDLGFSEEIDKGEVEGSPMEHDNNQIGSAGTCHSNLRSSRGAARDGEDKVVRSKKRMGGENAAGECKRGVSDGESSTAQDEPRQPEEDDYSDIIEPVVCTKGYSNDQKSILSAVYELFEKACMNCSMIGRERMACSMLDCTNTVCRTCFRVNEWDWNAAMRKNSWVCISCRSKSEYQALRIPIIATAGASTVQPECLGPKRCHQCRESGEVPRSSKKQTGEDGWEFFCHLCKQKGEMMCCMKKKCTRVVCIKCFEEHGWDWEEAMKMAKWRCPHCRLDCPRCKANKLRKKQRVEKLP